MVLSALEGPSSGKKNGLVTSFTAYEFTEDGQGGLMEEVMLRWTLTYE